MSCPTKSLPIVEPPRHTDLPRFWRSLEELAGAPDFAERVEHEFPRHASVWDDATDRRRFLQLMAASLALAGAQGCSSPPPEPIVPYVRPPVGMTPGVPLYFATAMPAPGGALGVVVTSHMGRPTKIEGNPLHPASLGAASAQAQASVLTMYDPDRSQTARHLGVISTWEAFLEDLRQRKPALGQGRGLRIVSAPVTSPTLARQRDVLLEKYPGAKWISYDPAGSDAARRGSEAVFGETVQAVYQFSEADVVLSLDADFLTQGGGAVRYCRDFMARRGAESGGGGNRLYVVESTCTPTGTAADHRLPLRPSDVERFARALAAELGISDTNSDGLPDGVEPKWLAAVAYDLRANRGKSLVVVGAYQSASVHALGHAINDALGNGGSTVKYTSPIEGDDDGATLGELVDDLNAGAVELLLLLDVNPVYDAPPKLDFAAALQKAKLAVHYGLYDDETAEFCHWHIPATHYLESWSDQRAYDGTAAIVQPLIAPLYDGKTIHEVVAAVIDDAVQPSYDLVRATWQASFGDEFEARWTEALRDGVVADSAAEPQSPTLRGEAVAEFESPAAAEGDQFELAILPDPSIGDGRLANNGWLQELPKPLTKLTWGNAVLMAPATAENLALSTGDVVTLSVGEHSMDGPVCVVPGHPAGSLTCHFGYGRTRAGRVGTGHGFNAYRLRSASADGMVSGVKLAKTGRRAELARTQTHHEIDGRNIVHSATLAQFQKDPHSVLPESAHHPLPTLLPDMNSSEGFAWGMAIDLTKCHGCNACVVACQAENNSPVVGKDQVARGREMQWLRIDSYYEGAPENPEAINQPMLCQHCEKAPCELVCPVAATTHSDEGLNEMTYNRCIGTRYCSNNCPYKVRRFNFLQYQDETTPVLKLLRNPEVTVRSRGVMEKCTYCVQRINHARIDAKKAAVESGGPPSIADGSLVTACQQSCPSQAIVFGDVNDPNSRVSKLKADARNYGVLSELGALPRTTYLVRLRNPNPAIG
jgi:MoCo/4Fe-4S cofactor protein with predicted Tat translocation signal